MEFLYPLVEFNWFHYLDGGNRGIPAAVGEGDSILNLGTSGVAGNDLITAAIGIKAILCAGIDMGIAWEFPLTGRHDLLNNRILAEVIFRY